jgi:hypothetical protein
MKSLKNPFLLVLIWIIALFVLCLSFMFYSKESLTFQKVVGGTFLLMIYSVIFSFPAFLFFFLVSYFTLRSEKLSIPKKKLVMLGANLTDIVFTFGALYVLVDGNNLQHDSANGLSNLKNIFSFYPLWVLTIISSLLIVVFPFNFNKSK